jgi:hypothetical protein
MKYSALIALVLVIAGVMIAGCTQSPGTAATPTSASSAVVTTASGAAVTSAPQPSFSLGDHYLQRSYSFQSEKDLVSEQFRVDNPSWGIDINVLPLNDDLQYCWFEMTVTNMDTGQKDTYGYGRSYSYEKHQQFPMYVTGPYKVDMKGNRVKVDFTAAKRNP